MDLKKIIGVLKKDVVARWILYTSIFAWAGYFISGAGIILLLIEAWEGAAVCAVLIGVISVVGEALRRKANSMLEKEGKGKPIPPMLVTSIFIKGRGRNQN